MTSSQALAHHAGFCAWYHKKPLGQYSQIHAGRTTVGLHIICDSGDNVQGPVFFSPSGGTDYWTYLFGDINCCLRQGPVPKCSISGDFYFDGAFLALTRPAKKSCTFSLCNSCLGLLEVTVSRGRCRPPADAGEKLILLLLSMLG